MIVGHTKQLQTLHNFLTGAPTHHGFLFTGPEHVGKYTIARCFAQQLITGNTMSQWTDTVGAHPDMLIVEPATAEHKGKIVTKDISVEQIRDMRTSFALSTNTKAKVLIINDAHRLTISAQSALLKTIEEPPRNRYIIIVTHAPDALLDTIASRCFTLRFDMVRTDDIRKMVLSHDAYEHAYGRPGFAFRVHTDPAFRATVEDAHRALNNIFHTKTRERLVLAREVAQKDVRDIVVFFTVWSYRIWHAAHKTHKLHLLHIADRIEQLLLTMQQTPVNKQLLLEDFFIRL